MCWLSCCVIPAARAHLPRCMLAAGCSPQQRRGFQKKWPGRETTDISETSVRYVARMACCLGFSLAVLSASFLTWNSSLRLLPAWKGHGLNRGQQRAAVLAPSQLHREMCRCSNNACLLGGLGPMKPGPLQLHQASLKDGCWHAEGERLPAWWQCYTAIQGTGFCDLEESSKISIKSLPNVCSLSLCLFFSTLLWCWWVSYSGKSLGIEFTNGFL